MSTITLTTKAAKLMKLCDIEGLRLEELLSAAVTDSVCQRIPFIIEKLAMLLRRFDSVAGASAFELAVPDTLISRATYLVQ